MAITLIHWRDHCRIDCDCVVQNGIRLTDTCDDACNLTGKYLKGKELPNYPVPAIPLEVIPMVINGECIAIDIIDRSSEPWPVVAMFDKY